MHQRTRGPSGGHTCRLKGLEGLFSSAQAGGCGSWGASAAPWVGLNVLRAGIDTQQYRAYRITGRSGLLAEAEATMRRAKRLLTETTGSGILNQWEDAKDAYLAAAACFAEAGEAARGGEAYCLASDCVAKLGSDVETAWCLSKAAEVYGRTSPLGMLREKEGVFKKQDSEMWVKVPPPTLLRTPLFPPLGRCHRVPAKVCKAAH